ncbi:hypothetical protein PR048_028229 [Dryococelus australis]|uniref:Mutator-like transposase domain-containing protein n=1 Tax=Dryococelus australis TaxID=614101 RepID=A0ABQ9GIP1_9NEOP|nr:hypothetical protein PR048_028229 [Dryococelus australis]
MQEFCRIGVGQCWVHAQKTNKRSTVYSIYERDGGMCTMISGEGIKGMRDKGACAHFGSQSELLVETRHEVGDKDINLKNIEGRRIRNISHVISQARALERRTLKCKARDFSYEGEKRFGLRSVLYFKCNSFEDKSSIDTDQCSTVNTAATWGTIMTGKGYSAMEQLLSMMEIPAPGSRTFKQQEEEIAEVSCGTSCRRRAQHAIKEYVNKDGVPYIMVIVDEGWSHRSYGHSYVAKSGVAIIYCSTCYLAKTRKQKPNVHNCYKNWSSCSFSMESDILVEGFKASEKTHGLRYLNYIGDGNSSVQKAITERVPYDLQVVKTECTNHPSKENCQHKKILSQKRIKYIQRRIRHIQRRIPEKKTQLLLITSLETILTADKEICNKAKTSSVSELDTAPGNVLARMIPITGNFAAKARKCLQFRYKASKTRKPNSIKNSAHYGENCQLPDVPAEEIELKANLKKSTPALERSPHTKPTLVPFLVGVTLPDFRLWGRGRTMSLVSGFSRDSPVTTPPPGPIIPALLHTRLIHPHRLSGP